MPQTPQTITRDHNFDIAAARRGCSLADVGARRWWLTRATAALTLLSATAATASIAQSPGDPVEQGAIEQSCKSLQGGSAGTFDQTADANPGSFPPTWTEAPAGLLPAHVYLRTATETFNRLYEFATRGGQIYGRPRSSADPWRELPLPLCFAGHVASISLDDDEMIALDDARRIYTMDNALKDPSTFNWTNRWGTPFWAGPGYALPGGIVAWSWSVISPLEDKRWTDPAGNHQSIGSGKVSHIWSLRSGGRRITFNDPWLPLDESYEMCGPVRGRFRAVNLSASGSEIFVIGPHGDLFTRIYDFDLSGHDGFFFQYSYDDQRGKGDTAPIQLPAAPWVQQPKIPGKITSAISVEKTGVDAVHRILRVEGEQNGKTGYWERDIAQPASAAWSFHDTGAPLIGKVLDNPPADTSQRDLGKAEDFAYRMTSGDTTADLLDFNPYCSPARLRIRQNGTTKNLLLHTVDALRQQVRARGLDDSPRDYYAALEGPPGHFETVSVKATTSEVVIPERNWTFKRVVAKPAPRRLTKIRVSPRTGRRKTAFLVTFRSPRTARYTVDVAGPKHTRCDLTRIGPGRRFKNGKRARIKIYPDIRGWCRGRYRVTVDEVAGKSPADRFVIGRAVHFRVR